MSGKYFPSSHEINRKAEKCILKLAENGDHTSIGAIERSLCRELSVSSLSGVGVRRVEDLPSVRDHAKLLNRVAAYAPVFVRVFSIATLDALEECLLEFGGGGGGLRGWKALALGPLEKIPAVREAFEIPPHVTKIRRISTTEVVRHLQDYTSRSGLWSGVVDPRQFCQFLDSLLGVGGNEILGLKVSSTILATQSFKKAHRDLESFKTKFRFELQYGLDDMRAQLIGRSSANVGVGLKMRYCQMDSISVINDVLRKYHLLMSAAAYKKLSKRERRLSQVVEQFLEMLDVRDDLSHIVVRKLLQTAICASNMESPKDVAKILGVDVASLNNPEDGGGGKGDGVTSSSSKPSPTVSELTRKFTELTDRCMAQGSLTLSQLTRIEEKLAEFFGFADFPRLGFGSFLSFLTKQPEPKRVLEHLIGDGMSLVGCGDKGRDGGGESSSKYQHSHDQVLAFIRQCQVSPSSQSHKHVEDALCEYHDVADVRALGFGPLDKLVAAAASAASSSSAAAAAAAASERVFYEKALCAKTSSYAGPLLKRARHGQSGQKLVGVMGAMTRDKALKCLRACPPLYDLEEWSHWARVFEPQFGSLKDFINSGQKKGSKAETAVASAATSSSKPSADDGEEEILAMECQPGLLLKLPSSSSAEEFGRCVERLDARATCGQLCHLVTSSFGPSNAPLTLLANHAQSALRKADAAIADRRLPPLQQQQQQQNFSNSVKFVFNCLQLLPLQIASAAASRVLVEPLGLVVGSTLSKRQIVQLAKQPKHLSRIQHLGWLLGIVEWSASFADRLDGSSSTSTGMLTEGSAAETNEGRQHFDGRSRNRPSSSPFAPQSSSSPFAPQPPRASSSPFAPQPAKSTVCDNDDDDDEDDGGGGAVEMLTKDPLSDDEEPEKEGGDGSEAGTETPGDEAVTKTPGDEAVTELKVKPNLKEECRHFIEEIRRDDFGVGVEMSETASKLVAVQQARLGRSLKRLAEDLYSKETHFVLELIQNADDNSYEEGVKPALEFLVDNDRILVHNNEKGFTKEDVRAICDIGNSTKGRVQGGYIGQKGIGFKSVFKISDRPEIRSAGFSFKFDSKQGPVGYILPEWLEEEGGERVGERVSKEESTEGTDAAAGQSKDLISWTTSIRLPLAAGRGIIEIKSGFLDIHPTLLLFLRKLTSIRVVDAVANHSVLVERRDRTKGNAEVLSLTTTTKQTSLGAKSSIEVVEEGEEESSESFREAETTTTTTVVTSDWLLARKQLPLSGLPSTYVTRPADQIRFTELTLAFPLGGDAAGASRDENNDEIEPLRQPLPVFAFLPLRSYGFDFVIQGDFDVPSSREDLESDSPWNQWLLSHLPNLFVDSLPLFADVADGDVVRALEQFLPFLPSTRRVAEEPFSTIAKKIFARLKQIPWVPVRVTAPDDSSSSSSATPVLRLSCETAVPCDPLVRSVLPPALLSQAFGLSYVDEKAERFLRSRPREDVNLLSDLGIQSLGLTHLLEVGQSIADTRDVGRIGRWLSAVAKLAFFDGDDNYLDPTTIENIKDLPIVPLANERFVRLSDCPVVYFPRDRRRRPKRTGERSSRREREELPEGEEEEEEEDGEDSNWFVSELEADLSTVSSTVFEFVDDDDFLKWRLKKLLTECGVKEARPKDVIHDHILPVLRDEERRKEKSKKTLITYVVYLKEQWSKKNFDPKKADLDRFVLLSTNEGMLNPKETPIHFGADYGNALVPDLPSEFPSVDWKIIDSTYLRDSVPGGAAFSLSSGAISSFEISLWRDFFALLGVTDFLRVDARSYVLSLADVLHSSDADYFQRGIGDVGVDPMDDGPDVRLEDYECPELESILRVAVDASSSSTTTTTMQRLFELLEAGWTTNFGGFVEKKIVFRDRTIAAPSSFARRLLEMEWIPCLHYGGGGGGGNSDADGYGDSSETHSAPPALARVCFLSPGNSYIFVRNSRVISLCADLVPYVVPGTSKDAECASAFCRFLGLLNAVSVDVVVDLLKSWSSRTNMGEPRSFTTSTSHMLRVYSFLREEMPPKRFKELISGGPAVFLPSTANVKMKNLVEGMFVGGNEVCWADPSKTFKKYRPVLPSCDFAESPTVVEGEEEDLSRATPRMKYTLYEYYPAVQAKDLFLQAGVTEFPSVEEYLRMIVFVARLSAPAVSLEVLHDIRHVYAALGKVLRHRKLSYLYDEDWSKTCDGLREKIKNLSIFPTKNREFVSLNDSSPVLADGDDLERVFREVDEMRKRTVDVSVEILEDADSDARFFLAEVCGFPLLSSRVVESVKEAKNFAVDKRMKTFLRRLFPLAQRFLFAHHPGAYGELIRGSTTTESDSSSAIPAAAAAAAAAVAPLADELARLKIFRAERVLVEYRLMGVGSETEEIVVESTEKAFWSDDACFWIQRRSVVDAQISLLDLSAALARRLGRGNAEARGATYRFLLRVSPALLAWASEKDGDEESFLRDLASRFDLEELPPSETVWELSTDDEEEEEVKADLSSLPKPAVERESGVVLQVGLDANDVISDISSAVGGSIPSTVAPRPVKSEARAEGAVDDENNSDAASISSKATYLDDVAEAGSPPTNDPDGEIASVVSGATQGRQSDVEGSDGIDGVSLLTAESAASEATRLLAASAAAAAAALNASAGEAEDGQMPPPNRLPPKRKWSSKYSDGKGAGDEEYEAAMKAAKTKRRDDEDDDDDDRPILLGFSEEEEKDREARSRYFADSAWRFSGIEDRFDDVEYEHVGGGAALRLPETESLMRKSLMDKESGGGVEVGRWGEELVYKYLLSRLKKPDSGIVQVSWGNKFGESGMPYDIVVRKQSPSRESETIYVEVKATRSHEKQLFEISPNEVQFALDQKENYHLFRVFNAGNPEEVRIAKIVNVCDQLEKKSVKLCMMI